KCRSRRVLYKHARRQMETLPATPGRDSQTGKTTLPSSTILRVRLKNLRTCSRHSLQQHASYGKSPERVTASQRSIASITLSSRSRVRRKASEPGNRCTGGVFESTDRAT